MQIRNAGSVIVVSWRMNTGALRKSATTNKQCGVFRNPSRRPACRMMPDGDVVGRHARQDQG